MRLEDIYKAKNIYTYKVSPWNQNASANNLNVLT